MRLPRTLRSFQPLTTGPSADAKVDSRFQEVGLARFNLTAGEHDICPFGNPRGSTFQDLSPLFHWNTKQLFIYVTAEYNNSDGVRVVFERRDIGFLMFVTRV